METGPSAVEDHLTVVANPDHADRLHRNERAAQGMNTGRETLNCALVDRLKDKEIAITDEMTTADPALEPFLSQRRQQRRPLSIVREQA